MSVTGDEIREAFLSFFGEKGHRIISSSSLIPHGDPTLLLTSAGMVQFKPYFLGESEPPSPRLASCQKCFRTTDIESVGDASHLTFFEMLGNFSVGDYFKTEAIALAWQFVTRRLGLEPERLWVTVFLDDDEAFRIWRKMGIPQDRILRFGEEDNFWGPAGDSGPCGPCSEIHYDFGPGVGCGQASCAPNCLCGRFSEIWNLVFMQYNQDRSGRRSLLPKPNIDTGMGLERTAAVIQGKTSVYDTDLFAPLIGNISKFIGKKYGSDDEVDKAMRVVVEHGRALTFLIADGVLPSNEGRGYVLRRLLRRAALFGRRLGLDKPFLAEMAKVTIEQMGNIYPELLKRRDFILELIELEEARFGETLDTGLEVIEGLLDSTMTELVRSLGPTSEFAVATRRIGEAIGKAFEPLQKAMIRPEILQAFQQYQKAAQRIGEAIGKAFEPLQKAMIRPEILQAFQQYQKTVEQIQKAIPRPEISQAVKQYEMLLKIPGEDVFKLYDTYGFPKELTQEVAAENGFFIDSEGFEKEMAKQREKGRASHKFELAEEVGLKDRLDIKDTFFVGYSNLKNKTIVVGLMVDNEGVATVKEGQKAGLILASTPFYGEMGGQMGDTGEIISSSGRFSVTNAIRVAHGMIMHQGQVIEGSMSVNDEVEAEVDKERRLDIARNHTATHLLQLALRQVLGEHVQQRGSVVAPDRLRFDFCHLKAMAAEEIQKVESVVNDKVRQNLPVSDEEIPYKQAIQEGVIAIFGEKYGDVVRVLRIGRPPVSAELCGGTHVAVTGEIGFLRIISEGSIGAGLRRIEAVTGRGAEKAIGQEIDSLGNKVSSLLAKLDDEIKRAQTLEKELARVRAEALLGQAEVVSGVRVLARRVPSSRPETLRQMTDYLRQKLKSVVIVLGTVYQGKPVFLAVVTPDLVAKGYHAGRLVSKVAELAGGGGGGRASLAQGGGRDKAKLDGALKAVRDLI